MTLYDVIIRHTRRSGNEEGIFYGNRSKTFI